MNPVFIFFLNQITIFSYRFCFLSKKMVFSFICYKKVHVLTTYDGGKVDFIKTVITSVLSVSSFRGVPSIDQVKANLLNG